jgi:hypothetical protein
VSFFAWPGEKDPCIGLSLGGVWGGKAAPKTFIFRLFWRIRRQNSREIYQLEGRSPSKPPKSESPTLYQSSMMRI